MSLAENQRSTIENITTILKYVAPRGCPEIIDREHVPYPPNNGRVSVTTSDNKVKIVCRGVEGSGNCIFCIFNTKHNGLTIKHNELQKLQFEQSLNK